MYLVHAVVLKAGLTEVVALEDTEPTVPVVVYLNVAIVPTAEAVLSSPLAQ